MRFLFLGVAGFNLFSALFGTIKTFDAINFGFALILFGIFLDATIERYSR